MAYQTNTYAYSLTDYGTFLIAGNDAELFIKTMFSGNLSLCQEIFTASCGLLLNSDAEVIDVVYVIRTGDNEFLMLTSSQNAEEDFDWLEAHANLEQNGQKVFYDLTFENQTGNLANLLLFGNKAFEIFTSITNLCKNKVAYIASEIKEPCYGIPANHGFFLFVPLAVAPEIGILLNRHEELEMLTDDEFNDMLKNSNVFCPQLNEGKYYKPSELNLNYLLRKTNDFVGARAL